MALKLLLTLTHAEARNLNQWRISIRSTLTACHRSKTMIKIMIEKIRTDREMIFINRFLRKFDKMKIRLFIFRLSRELSGKSLVLKIFPLPTVMSILDKKFDSGPKIRKVNFGEKKINKKFKTPWSDPGPIFVD